MKGVAVLLVAALALVAAPADAKRGKLRGKVRTAHGKAPKRWGQVTKWTPAAPAPTPTPTASPAATPTPSATPGSVLPEPNPRSVSVASTEWAFTLSQPTVASGTVRIEFDNSRAEDPHKLTVDGPVPHYWAFSEVEAGGVTVERIVMPAGRYVLFCPLPEHEERGMRAVLTVRD